MGYKISLTGLLIKLSFRIGCLLNWACVSCIIRSQEGKISIGVSRQ